MGFFKVLPSLAQELPNGSSEQGLLPVPTPFSQSQVTLFKLEVIFIPIDLFSKFLTNSSNLSIRIYKLQTLPLKKLLYYPSASLFIR